MLMKGTRIANSKHHVRVLSRVPIKFLFSRAQQHKIELIYPQKKKHKNIYTPI
jgi:hypothetical protein